jgi:hypothetical protein
LTPIAENEIAFGLNSGLYRLEAILQPTVIRNGTSSSVEKHNTPILVRYASAIVFKDRYFGHPLRRNYVYRPLCPNAELSNAFETSLHPHGTGTSGRTRLRVGIGVLSFEYSPFVEALKSAFIMTGRPIELISAKHDILI